MGGKAGLASRRTCSSTRWMLTAHGARSASRRTPPCGRPARGCGRPRRGSARSSSRSFAHATLPSSSCAAPRMPESGFFTSCARTAAMPVTLRAALRNTVSWRSSARAAELVLQRQQHRSRAPRAHRRALHDDAACLCRRGLSSDMIMIADRRCRRARTCWISRNSGCRSGSRSPSEHVARVAASDGDAEKLLGRGSWQAEPVRSGVQQHGRGLGSARQHRQRAAGLAGSRRAALAFRRPSARRGRQHVPHAAAASICARSKHHGWRPARSGGS